MVNYYNKNNSESVTNKITHYVCVCNDQMISTIHLMKLFKWDALNKYEVFGLNNIFYIVKINFYPIFAQNGKYNKKYFSVL